VADPFRQAPSPRNDSDTLPPKKPSSLAAAGKDAPITEAPGGTKEPVVASTSTGKTAAPVPAAAPAPASGLPTPQSTGEAAPAKSGTGKGGTSFDVALKFGVDKEGNIKPLISSVTKDILPTLMKDNSFISTLEQMGFVRKGAVS